jgi:arylsulfatase A
MCCHGAWGDRNGRILSRTRAPLRRASSAWDVVMSSRRRSSQSSTKPATASSQLAISGATVDRPPNVLLVNCDDLGYGDLGCYGSLFNRTPAVDTLAAEGVRLTDFYMASPVCSPSRGAMLTGCYPPRIGFGVFDDGHTVLLPGDATGLNPAEATLASVLRARGYATAHIGKWHCGDQPEFLPTRHGFDVYFGLPYSNDMGLQPNWPECPPLPLLRGEAVVEEQPDQTSLTERYVHEGVAFMRENRDRPFFLYFAHLYVHLPLYVPERFLAEAAIGPYGAAVECIDWAMGELLGELDALDIADDTIVIFTSDNGSLLLNGGSNAPLRGRKAQTWEGGLRVPCVIRWPGAIPPGAIRHDVVTSMDFLPTLVSIVGATLPVDRLIDGRDVTTILTGNGPRPGDRPFFYYLGDQLEAVRHGRWKLQVRRGAEEVHELYDLRADIGETRNAYDDHPRVVRRLERELAACRVDIGDSATGIEGSNRRDPGRVVNPVRLTTYDPDHPYVVASYDLPGEPYP